MWRRSSKEAADAAVQEQHTAKILEHDTAITALRAGHDSLNGAVMVLKDIERRREESDRRKDEKLDRLLAGQAEMQGRMLESRSR